jgi:hypothetical protein
MTKENADGPDGARPEDGFGIPDDAREYGAVVSFRMPLDALIAFDHLVGADRNPRIRSAAIRALLEGYIADQVNARARSKPQRIG